uniref:G-protein coupled receptors family 1 profile domain-containing protein n=1 Tax=Junco hyemalis TaxID=40217 RepID=A0A8C5JM59_JUNHY
MQFFPGIPGTVPVPAQRTRGCSASPQGEGGSCPRAPAQGWAQLLHEFLFWDQFWCVPPISILFCNLAVSDLFTSFSGFWISMLFITYPDITIFGSRDMLAPYSLIGIERYLAVAESMRTRFRVARNHSVAVVFINWVLAFFLGCLPLMGWNCLHAQSNVSVLYSPFCVNYLVFIAMPNVAMAFLVPLFTYLRIIIILRKRKLRMQACGQATGTYRSAETQVARTSISIWLLALVSYAPFLAGVVFDAANRRCHGELYPGVYIFRNCTAMLITLTLRAGLTGDNRDSPGITGANRLCPQSAARPVPGGRRRRPGPDPPLPPAAAPRPRRTSRARRRSRTASRRTNCSCWVTNPAPGKH